MERREFVKFCAASALAGGSEALAADSQPHLYTRAKLVDEKGAPLRAGAIPANQNLIFHYPFAATPCFLLNLGKPVAASVQLPLDSVVFVSTSSRYRSRNAGSELASASGRVAAPAAGPTHASAIRTVAARTRDHEPGIRNQLEQ